MKWLIASVKHALNSALYFIKEKAPCLYIGSEFKTFIYAIKMNTAMKMYLFKAVKMSLLYSEKHGEATLNYVGEFLT